jgi:alpha-D-ribose 1-methylphosphonate 5-triphosphate synthase subunit PhnH
MTAMLSPGFADPVTEAQRCFRAVLDAMSRPGQCHRIAGTLEAPRPLGHAAAALLLTLVDHSTSLWLDPAAADAMPWIAFHCGAPVAPAPRDAMFGVALSLPDLAQFSAGTHEAPETSATVIVEVVGFDTGRSWRLSGPGLQHPRVVQIAGLPEDFAARWQRNRAHFPCGVDLVLCAGDVLTALPRSITIEEA